MKGSPNSCEFYKYRHFLVEEAKVKFIDSINCTD